MKNFENNLYEMVIQCRNLSLKEEEFLFPKIIPISQLKCRIKNRGVLQLTSTPHYNFFAKKNILKNYFNDSKKRLLNYFKMAYPNDYEAKIFNAVSLLDGDSAYLNGEYSNSAILVDSNNEIIDGNLRAARLASLGAKNIIVNEIRRFEKNFSRVSLDYLEDRDHLDGEMKEYLSSVKNSFKEWYSPLELGPFLMPKITYPDFREVWDFDDGEGIRNWNSAIKHVLPDLTGKSVLDIGSNMGLFSLELARLGANVCGVDRGPGVVQPNNHHLGSQSVPNQAYFIRNLYESYYAVRFPNVAFAEIDLMDFDFSDTKCDIFFSCRVLYHLGSKRMGEIISSVSKNIPEIILQSNEGHAGKLGRISSMEFHKKLLKKCGYKIRREWSPAGCHHPVVYATK